MPPRLKSRHELFETLWESDLPPEDKTSKRFAQEAFANLVAGAETTGRTIARAIYFITSTPGVLTRLQAELKVVMPDVSDVPAWKDLENLPWLVSA